MQILNEVTHRIGGVGCIPATPHNKLRVDLIRDPFNSLIMPYRMHHFMLSFWGRTHTLYMVVDVNDLKVHRPHIEYAGSAHENGLNKESLYVNTCCKYKLII